MNTASHDTTTTLLQSLQKINVLKFGEFKLKSGLISPVYIDLRHLGCHPDVLKQVSMGLWQKIENVDFDFLCGVPYAALPIATTIGILQNQPILLRRKEVKSHGTGKLIEGEYHAGQSCIVIEDVITKGTSILETLKDIEEAGLIIKGIACVVDRQQGGIDHLNSLGYTTYSLLTLQEILQHASI